MDRSSFGSGGSSRDAALRIKALDNITSSNIRNSQVITNVCDVVRELVENSVDAGASRVVVYLEKFGLQKIEVRDNGHGIKLEDIERVFQGGHTSKLKDTTHLSRGKYFGFKGQALRALCAAGTVSVCTKLYAETVGRKYQLNPLGQIEGEGRASLNEGTTITVMKLFEGIRVRRQRLESKVAAANQLKDVETFLKEVSLANPKCHVSLYHESSLVWSKASVETTEQALVAVLGYSIAKNMEKCGPFKIRVQDLKNEYDNNGSNNNAKEDEGCSIKRVIELYLPKKPVEMRLMSLTSNKLAMIFCNRKRVYNSEIQKLIHKYITSVVVKQQPADQRRFPISILNITIPPDEADFNCNLDKSNVLLVHKDEIIEAVENALVSYYQVDLKKVVEARVVIGASDSNSGSSKSKDECPRYNNKNGTFASQNNNRQDILHDVSPSQSVLPHKSVEKREESIGMFMEDLPSFSLAFSESPSKSNQQNFESITTEFPVLKPVSEPQVATPSYHAATDTSKMVRDRTTPLTSSIVSNFELNIDTQMLLGEDDSIQFSSPEKDVFIPLRQEPLQQESQQVPEHLSTQMDRVASNGFQNWLEGRITDERGSIVENVYAVTNPSDSTKSEELRRTTYGPQKLYYSNNRSLKSQTITPTQSTSNLSIAPPPQKRQKIIDEPTFASPRPTTHHLWNTSSSRSTTTTTSQHHSSSGGCTNAEQPTLNCIERTRKSSGIPVSIMSPSSLAFLSEIDAASVRNLALSSTTSISKPSPATRICNLIEEQEKRQRRDCNYQQPSTNIVEDNLSGTGGIRRSVNSNPSNENGFRSCHSIWNPGLENYCENISKAECPVQIIGKLPTPEGKSSIYVTQSEEGIGAYCPDKDKTLRASSSRKAVVSPEPRFSDVLSRFVEFLEQQSRLPQRDTSVFQILATTDTLAKTAASCLHYLG